MEERLQRLDALLTRLEGIVATLVSGTGGAAPSGASDRILPWQVIAQTPEEKKAEQEQIDKIIEKALSERQEPLPLAD